MTNRKLLGLLIVALFLVSIAGAASAASLDLPKWVIVPEDSTFSDVTLYCPLDAYDATNNVTPCFINGNTTYMDIHFNDTSPSLVTGKIGNAFHFAGVGSDFLSIDFTQYDPREQITITAWVKILGSSGGYDYLYILNRRSSNTGSISNSWRSWSIQYVLSSQIFKFFLTTWNNGLLTISATHPYGDWTFVAMTYDGQKFRAYIDGQEVGEATASGNIYYDEDDPEATTISKSLYIGDFDGGPVTPGDKIIDEIRIYNRALTDDEIKLLYLAGRKKLSEPANFRQIFSPMIDLTRDRATFYAGLEVSTTDPNGYVPVPESAVNMSITSAPRLKSDYTNADFYYQGHYWYRADKIQFNLPIQFETVREKGGFSKTILLDKDSKSFVYEKEFKVTNPTAARLNVVYSVDPTALGFSVLQYPAFELDGIRMVAWQPQNSTSLYLIRTDTLEPGEISTHWIKSIWTIKKEELEFPAKLEDFRNILDWQTAQKLAENAVKGKSDTYVKVIKIDSNADVSNVTILVPLKDVEDESDVVEAVALTGSRETLQVEKLEDGKIVVKVPADAFVSGSAEIKIFYNKETSWWKSILDKIRSLMTKIKAMFFGGG